MDHPLICSQSQAVHEQVGVMTSIPLPLGPGVLEHSLVVKYVGTHQAGPAEPVASQAHPSPGWQEVQHSAGQAQGPALRHTFTSPQHSLGPQLLSCHQVDFWASPC